jgi:hypothetical protein
LLLKANRIEKNLFQSFKTLDFNFVVFYINAKPPLQVGNNFALCWGIYLPLTLLLIFYLILDQNVIPLIIDQPEENLDNQSVFNILVQFIKKAKEKRQIIIVTHNPNLAVVCNAEQIIHVSIDKKNKNTVSIVSGALEDEILNDAVIDILEGTYPALNTRTLTYSIIERKL